jgi:hypothetical protein
MEKLTVVPDMPVGDVVSSLTSPKVSGESARLSRAKQGIE